MSKVENINFNKLENDLTIKKDNLIKKFKVLNGNDLTSNDIISISNEYISIMKMYGTLDYNIKVYTNENMMPITYGNYLSLPTIELNRSFHIDYKEFKISFATFNVCIKIKDLLKINTGLNIKQIIESIKPRINSVYLLGLNLSDEELLNIEVSIDIKIKEERKVY